MGMTRDLFKKVKNGKGTFHAKNSIIKDRNGMDLREAEDTNQRWQEYTEKLYKNDLNDPDNHNGGYHDIIQYKVRWALGSITMNKTSGGGGIPIEQELKIEVK